MGDLPKYRSDPRLPLSVPELNRLAAKLRAQADQPGLTPDQRRELRRVARNGELLAKRRARRNQHPQHPTKQ
jgi:hypothetical protein